MMDKQLIRKYLLFVKKKKEYPIAEDYIFIFLDKKQVPILSKNQGQGERRLPK
jgi:hypothetical protein